MHEGFTGGAAERPIDPVPTKGTEPAATEPGRDPVLDDPRILQVLSTEHWSLLSARGLAYNEAFTRAAMFLTLLSMSLVALALLAGQLPDTQVFLTVGSVVLGFDFLVGLLTAFRVIGCNVEDGRAMAGMNRIRNGYVQILPGVAPFFMTDIHDDIRGVSRSYGFEPGGSVLGDIAYGLSTTVGLVVIVDSVIGGATAAMVAATVGANLGTAVIAGAIVLVLSLVAMVGLAAWMTYASADQLRPRYPSPDIAEGDRW